MYIEAFYTINIENFVNLEQVVKQNEEEKLCESLY
jgi:hypothetical protein